MQKLIDMEQVMEDMKNAQDDINKILQNLGDKHHNFNFDPNCTYRHVTLSDGKSHRDWYMTLSASLELGLQETER